MTSKRTRIFLVGVGGQGTLTATSLLAAAAMDKGLDVTSGEIHGMAQRGGVVESTILLGGWRSPRIGPGEADVLLGFEPLETLRALPYLAPGGTVVSNREPVPPLSVSLGRDEYPDLELVRAKVEACAAKSRFLPCRSLGLQAGAVQSGNMALLGAVCALGVLPLSVDDLVATVEKRLRPKLVEMNLKALRLGVEAVS